MSAAITAKLAGLDALIAEKAPQFGGTTARSGGWIWIPLSPQARMAGIDDSPTAAMTYLRHEAGAHLKEALADSFLTNGPRMLELFAQRTSVQLDVSQVFPDYHPDAPGARLAGRSLFPVPFDARELGANLRYLAPPLSELSFLGMTLGSGTELMHFFNVTRSWVSLAFVLRRVMRHGWERLRYGRGMRLVNGAALAGRLGKTVFDLDIPLWLNCPVTRLEHLSGRITGAVMTKDGVELRVQARKGVVLAAGGFPHDAARRQSLCEAPANATRHFSLASPGNTGDGLRLAESVGGRITKAVQDCAAWTPVSLIDWGSGRSGVYPHFIDRGKPGIIAVTSGGRRFVNESDSYHDFMRAFHALLSRDAGLGCFFVCDHRAMRRYGMGMVKPIPFSVHRWSRSGYLVSGQTLQDLAANAGINAEALSGTIREFNLNADLGKDPAYGRGRTAYNRFQGDLGHRPNPCLAPLDTPPFYAIRIRTGDIGTFAGVEVNRDAQVLDVHGGAVPGLYAAGNDMSSLMGGTYPGAGITLGPALVFGYIAATHMAGASQT